MKNLVSFVSVGLLASVSVMATINWNSGSIENLAQGATVTASSNSATAGNIVDGIDGTSWQANPATHEFTHDWVMLDLGAEKSFTDIEIVWEASHCKQYSVYVSADAIPYATDATNADANVISADWLAAHQPVAVGGDDTEAGYVENIEFKTPETGQYILIYANEYNNYGSEWGMRIFEIRVADIQNRNVVESLRLSQDGSAVAGGDAVTVSVVPVNIIGESMDFSSISNLKLTCGSDAVTIEGGENGVYSVTASEYGTYVLTATAMADGKEVSGSLSLSVAYNWAGTENLATNRSIQGRVKADAEDSNPPVNAVDGDLATYYQYNGEWGGGDSWLLVDLGDVYTLNAIGVYYSGNTSTGRCVFGYATDARAIEEKIAAEGTDFIWSETEGWTFTDQLDRTPDMVTTYVCHADAVVRYIVVKDADNPGGRPCVNEIYVSGIKREAPKADHIELTVATPGLVIGETTTVSASVFDQYGQAFDVQPEISVTGAGYADGVITGSTKGMVTVKASVGDLSEDVQFFVADQNDYCLDGSVITASEGASDNTSAVIDGGKDIAAWGADYVLAADETAGEHEHWMLVKLAKPYDLDLIAVLWEGACPADYDVYLGKTEESMELYYSQRDKAGLQNYSDRFSGKDMAGIQYVKVVTTSNATGYGIKLHDLKAYGTSNVESVADRIEVSADNNYVPTDTEVTLSATVYDQFGAEMAGVPVVYTCDAAGAEITGNTFKASVVGHYTVKATAGNASADVDIDVVVKSDQQLSVVDLINRVWLNGTLLENVNVFADNEIQMPTVPATLEFVFDNIPSFDLIEIRWEAACPSDYTVEATYADGTTATVLTVTDRKFVNGNFPVDKIVGTSAKARSLGVEGTANLQDVRALKFDITAKDHEYPIRLLGMTAYGTLIVTGIDDIVDDEAGVADVYNLQGVRLRHNVRVDEALEGLPHGFYIVGGRKVCK